MADNPDPAVIVAPGNPDPPVTPAPPSEVAWKSHLNPDFANSPTIKLFPDTKEGLNNAVKSHLELQKLMGHDKVPIPKGKDDLVARAIFNKALGIPDKPEGYALPDVEIPETMKGLTFDKAKFAQVVHAHELTPAAASGLWNAYTGMQKQAYNDALKAREEHMTGVINGLRQEWGDAYKSKVELGQMVINKFSADKETNDYITAVLTQDPYGIKFLAKIGEQFAENKIGDFKYQRHSLTPEEAQRELDVIKSDASHPYFNPKAPEAEHQRAMDYVNSLLSVIKRGKGQA